MRTAHRSHRSIPPRSAFAGFRFPADVIVLAVRWYLRFGLSYRDVEELLTERGVEVDHVTVYRWVLRFTPLLAEAARPCRHAVGDRWFVDETYMKVAGQWRYVYRAIDQFGQVIDVLVLRAPRHQGRPPVLRAGHQRDQGHTRRGCHRPSSDLSDGAGGVAASGVAPHRPVRQQSGRGDHGRLKARLRPMRGLKQDRSARVIVAGHGFVQNLRRGHYELAVAEPVSRRVAVAFNELALAI
jgi:transposase-like protein